MGGERARPTPGGRWGREPLRAGAATVLLTPQELQVAQLAAGGLSNKEIDAPLCLSPRTVGYHLYKLFPKLGISARSQRRDIDLGELPTEAARG